MSPEQAAGKAIDFRSDIWSLGAVIYEMLSGKSPFYGEYDEVVLYSIMNEDPQKLNTLNGRTPVELVELVVKCLQKDPKKRSS